MLLNDKTFSTFGYYYESLSPGSCKEVILSCDYCSTEFRKQKKVRIKSNALVDKDCCNDCRFKKREECLLLKYGVDNISKLESTKDKISKNCKSGLKTTIEKSKQTCLEKYGVDNFSKLEVNREKMRVDNPMQCDEVKEKARETSLRNYGETSYLKTKECKDKFKEKYGVDNPTYLPDHVQKSRETSLKKYGAEHYFKNPENVKKRKIN
jgi:hypothetical protein